MLEEVDTTYTRRVKRRMFLCKNMLIYLAPNVLFNALIPYLVFKEQGSVQLLNGEQNLARFLLPMSLLLPFMLTFDILKKTIEAGIKRRFDLVIEESFPKNKYIFRMAGKHAIATFLIVVAGIAALYFLMPDGHRYNIVFSSVMIGILAGFYSLFFPIVSVNKLKREI